MGSIPLSVVLVVKVRWLACRLPLTRQNYSMTATVTEDADLGYWSPDALDSLLRTHPDFCQPLLAILGAKIAESHEVERKLLTRDKQPAV